ncbi:16S rRNA (cytidine(1402)-2'-O)-methyltransferase [Roseovarius sp. 2305UL8-3]|uniref:16S rRNA (cytidine(1402)-2'-O)-methyltransferase n=1 Tax=Roseovarius conchicola TaxID=3121636 RepID=UPI003526DC33
MPKLSPGLYLIATPIGTARDITLRALDLLRDADMLLAEDTRSLRKLMDIHGVALQDRSIVAYHDHNGARVRPRILAALAAGQSVVYASEAGTPMVADPGFDLARAAVAEGHKLISAPGPSAVITALTLSGLPTDQFHFSGFLPNASSRRKSALGTLAQVPGTLVFYESPKRLAAMLRDAATTLGVDREAVICRELTKKFEEVLRGSLSDLAERIAEKPPKGEIVVLIGSAPERIVNAETLESSLRKALSTHSVRDAADLVSADLGVARRKVYQLALKLENET